jgi:PAS domain S-box-containing protein
LEKLNKKFNDDVPLYNIRILKSYIDFVGVNYPKINIDKILKHAGVTKFQYNDYGYWCNQRQMNRLQEILIKETGNKNISRDTGRNLVNTHNIIALYILGFINPVNLTRQFERVYKKISRAAIIRIRYLGNNKHELITTPIPGVKEEFYQCKNRIGSLEGLLKLFLYEYPRIDHPECYHQGATHCRYIISWNKLKGTYKWLRLRYYLIFISVLISLVALLLFPFNYFLISSLISFSSIAFLSYYLQKLEKEKLKDRIENLSEIAEDHWNELNISYRTTKLMQEVGNATSVVQNKIEIASLVLKVMMKRLDYRRCVILLEDNCKKKLFYAAGCGFSEEEVATINNSWLWLDSHNEAVVQKVFNTQEPVMIEDMGRSEDILDPNELAIAQKLKIQSMICVPIVHESKALGVIAVDRPKPQREFREGDINLLMAVASQTALSIANAKSFQQLQESEKKHRTLVETIQDIVYTIDLEGRFTYVSPMVAGITGYTDKELLGRGFIEIISPPYKDLVMQRFADSLKSGEISAYEMEIITKDKKAVPVELNVAPLTDNNGQLIGRIGVARDITKRHLEEAKRQEMEMRALTQDKLASLGEIATGVAHEINQPLSYIKIILESTLDDMKTENLDREELSGDFSESLRQVGKITNIISHLRTFGRSDAITFSPVKIARVFDDTLTLMNERLRIKNITIDTRIAEHFPVLHGNHAKLEQVFVNLIQNSMDALEEKGKGEIIITARVEHNEAVITYSDSGEGIDLKVKEKIFEPFFTTKEAGKGTGIGLSIVYSIIQEHAGTISCESEKGKGATFKIRLPIYLENAVSMSSDLSA